MRILLGDNTGGGQVMQAAKEHPTYNKNRKSNSVFLTSCIKCL